MTYRPVLLPKPRIKRAASGRWHCRSCEPGLLGMGDTPADAYQNWMERWAMSPSLFTSSVEQEFPSVAVPWWRALLARWFCL